MSPIKVPGSPQNVDGSGLRIAIVHARYHTTIIDQLVAGAMKSLLAAGVTEDNITVQTVAGSYELPLSVSRLYAASKAQASSTSNGIGANDLLAESTSDLSNSTPQLATQKPFDAIIAIGVVIKGTSMHFEYLSDAVSHGLMRVQLDLGVPVIFGLLTVLNEEQGLERAGLGKNGTNNHGEDWGRVAVEVGVKGRNWAQGKIV